MIEDLLLRRHTRDQRQRAILCCDASRNGGGGIGAVVCKHNNFITLMVKGLLMKEINLMRQSSQSPGKGCRLVPNGNTHADFAA